MEFRELDTVNPGLLRALVDASVINRNDPISVVRRITGPELERFCLRTPAHSFVWVEAGVPGGRFFPAAQLNATLQMCRNVIHATMPPLVSQLPEVIQPAYYVYPGLPTSELLFGILVAPFVQPDLLYNKESRPAGWDQLESVFDRLGSYLSTIHSIPLTYEVRQVLAKRSFTVNSLRVFLQRDSGAPERFVEVDDQLHKIISRYPRLMQAASNATSCHLQTMNPVLLHGTFSAGTVLVSFDPPVFPVILGWLEVWLGPCGYDLGFLLGELLELSAVSKFISRGLEDDLLRGAVSFVKCYAASASACVTEEFWRQIESFTALRIIDLSLRNSRYFGLNVERVEAILANVEELLPLWFRDISLAQLSYD